MKVYKCAKPLERCGSNICVVILDDRRACPELCIKPKFSGYVNKKEQPVWRVYNLQVSIKALGRFLSDIFT